MGEAKIFLIPCETNILHPAIRIEVTDSGSILHVFPIKINQHQFIVDDKDNHQKWELEIQVLEDKIDSLVKCCEKLYEENHTLKTKQGELVRDRAQLLEKTTMAKTRVESIIARLKSVEHEG